ncbi:hypothetical protein POTOM_043175 [Populus tomentosa]|uniref:Uncharacterized protein n=1 Tax=Populus tomentosa TaxID=118781 RepID=A0A8X7YLL8_POPTO|nr:hypothetical protein POTOM_043175 [Populus tomentosa]
MRCDLELKTWKLENFVLMKWIDNIENSVAHLKAAGDTSDACGASSGVNPGWFITNPLDPFSLDLVLVGAIAIRLAPSGIRAGALRAKEMAPDTRSQELKESTESVNKEQAHNHGQVLQQETGESSANKEKHTLQANATTTQINLPCLSRAEAAWELAENLALRFPQFSHEDKGVVAKTTTKVLKLKTSDNEVVEVEETAALQSEIIKSMVADGHSTDDAIPLFNVEKKTLAKIVEWLKKHASDASKDELHKWDADFLDVDTDSLYDLLRASNYLGIEVLLGQLTQKVADMITRNHHQPIKIRELFNIKNDFTPEEKEEILKENSWLI